MPLRFNKPNHMNAVKLPNDVHSPLSPYFLPADELIIVVCIFAVGVYRGGILNVVLFTALAYWALRKYRRFNEGLPDGALRHRLYWLGLARFNARVFPNPFIRDYIP